MNRWCDDAGGWPLTQNVHSGEGAPGFCAQTAPYGMNRPYGQTIPYEVNHPYAQTAPYGMNQPYGQTIPYGVNQPCGQTIPYEVNHPYAQTAPCGMNQPYGQTIPYGMNQPYGQNLPHEVNHPYAQNVPYGMNQPYGQDIPYGVNQPYEVSQPYGQNAVYGINQPYGTDVVHDADQRYGNYQPYGTDQLYGQNMSYEMLPVYGGNLSCAANASFMRTASHNLPVVYTAGQQEMIEPYQSRYQLAPINAKHVERRSDKQWEEQKSRMLLFGIAGVMIAAFLAIMIGMLIHDDGTNRSMSEVFSSWAEGLFAKNEDAESLPVVSFPTQSSGTVRGEMCAVSEDGSVFVRTEYGICRVGKNGDHYEYNGWAAELPPGVSVRCMAVYRDYLYLACGENGIYRVNTARSNTLSQIIDDYVVSFVIAEDNLFYLSMDYPETQSYGNTFGLCGELYIAGLNGYGRRSLEENVARISKYFSSADFVCVDGYLYFLDEDGNVKRMRTNGTGSRVVVEADRQKPSFCFDGFYENDGILYLPSQGGAIYAYDVETDRLKKVSDACISPSSSVLFAGDTLLYKDEWESIWRQIKDGEDTVYESPLNGTALWMQVIGENELIAFYEPQVHGSVQDSHNTQSGYHTVSFVNGEIRSETPVSMDYAVMPEVDMEEEPLGLLQGTAQEGCRASHFVFVGPNGASAYDHYVIYPLIAGNEAYGDVENNGLAWTYTDEDGEHTELLVEGEVGTFFVEDDELFYTQWNVEDGGYAFYCQSLDAPAEEAGKWCLIDSGMQKEFTCFDGMIYYVGMGDGRLYRYTLWSSESERISEAKVGCYDIYNGMIYYEDLSDRTLWKMRMDGTGAEQLDTPVDGEREALCQLKVCPYDGSVYLAVTLEGGQEQYASMCLFAEDGSMEFYFNADIGSFDRMQALYYRDGRLYYSAGFAFSIRVFDFEEYFEGGNGIWEGAYDTVFCEENMNTFTVTDEFVYVQSYMENDLIMVYDRLTGELIEEMNCSDR